MTGFSEHIDLGTENHAPSELGVTRETPYHVLLVSDFGGSAAGTVEGALEQGVSAVSADSFDELLRGARPTVRFTLADPSSTGGAMVEVSLRFASLEDFAPAALLDQLPATRSLSQVRAVLGDRLRGKTTAAEAAAVAARAAAQDAACAWIPESLKWKPSAAAAPSDAVDNLLGQLDLDGAPPASTSPPARSPIGNLVAAAAGAAGGSIPAEEASALRRTLGEIDRRLTLWLNTVLHGSVVQPLESAWRSLALLVSRMDFRKGLRLSVLHAPASDLLERFRTRLIDPVFDEGADAPDLIIVDRAFGNTATDFDTLDELAQHAASLPAVLFAGVSPAFFGVKHAWQIPTLPPLTNLLDQWQFAKWKSLRNSPYARALGVFFGRSLLREPHGRKDPDDLAFHYREECVAEKDLLWLNGALAAAVSAAGSVADTGWPTAMAGLVHGRLEGFPAVTGGPKGDKTFGPADTALPMPKIEEMAVAGVNVVSGIRDHADVVVWNGLTAARPQRMDTDALLEVSLPYQLFAGRLSALLFLLKPKLAGKGAAEIPPFVTGHVRQWLAAEDFAADALSVQTRPSEDDPQALELAVTVTPPRSILPNGIPVVMGYRLS